MIRALFQAIEALEKIQNKERHRIEKNLPENAGKSWERKEQEFLCESFDAGMTIKEIAQKLKRTEGSVQSRLVKLGRMQIVLPPKGDA